MHAHHEGKRRLSPSAATALAAAAASVLSVCPALVVHVLMPGSTTALVLSLVAAPLLVAPVSWATARRFLRAETSTAAQAVVRLATQDFTTPAPTGSADTRQLAEAIEHCRLVLGEREKSTKVHAAVARLLGAAIGRLAEGDYTARIKVPLPEPYRTFQNDFNTAMDALETSLDGLGGAGKRLAGQAREIGEASDLLARRAKKLAQRLDADLRVIDAGAARDPQQMLAVARNIMNGIAIATQRNIEAAAHFSDLGSQLARESAQLAALAGEEPDSPVAPASRPKGATRFPVSLGATALKLHG